MRVKNVSSGVRYGWREHDAQRDGIEADIAELSAMKASNIGEKLAQSAEIERLKKNLHLLPIRLVMTLPDEVHEVPDSARADFLAKLTDDWVLCDADGNTIPWPPGTVVRRTVAVTPRGLEADAIRKHISELMDIKPDGTRRDPRALAALAAG